MSLFTIIKNQQEYWLVDQIKKDDIPKEEYLQQLLQILAEWDHLKIGYLSLLMDERFENWLLQKNFARFQVLLSTQESWIIYRK